MKSCSAAQRPTPSENPNSFPLQAAGCRAGTNKEMFPLVPLVARRRLQTSKKCLIRRATLSSRLRSCGQCLSGVTVTGDPDEVKSEDQRQRCHLLFPSRLPTVALRSSLTRRPRVLGRVHVHARGVRGPSVSVTDSATHRRVTVSDSEQPASPASPSSQARANFRARAR